MFNIFLQSYRFKKLTDIKLDFLNGARFVIFDLDNTLVFPETTETTKQITDWFLRVNQNYKCIIVSNSRSFLKRSERVSKIFGCDIFLSRHKKPSKKLFRGLSSKYEFKDSGVVVIGDRVLTDILFGRLNEAKSILVDPLSGKESFWGKVIRIIEKGILFMAKVPYNGV